MMKLSPEFQRNLWLEMTPHRIVGMPSILAAIFFLMYLLDGGLGTASANSALVLYFLLTVIWGGKLVSESIVNEVKDRTWDMQRMSPISPWAMTWGKLFGSAVFTWYGALICLALYAFVSYPLVDGLWKFLLLMLGAGVFAQAVGMLISLMAMRKKFLQMRSISAVYLIFGIMAALPFVRMGMENRGTVLWFSYEFAALDFVLISLLLFLAWSLLGNYRLMRAELQLRNRPWVWISFVLFVVLYVAGLVPESAELSQHIHTVRLLVGYGIIICTVYLMIFSEHKNPVAFRRMWFYLKLGRWGRILEEVPCWLAALVLAFVFMLLLVPRDYSLVNYLVKEADLKVFVLTGFLFMLRDVAFILYLNLGRSSKRADTTAFLYLALLYFLAPAIFSAMNLHSMHALLLPWDRQAPVITIMSGVAQVVLLCWMLARRWGHYFDFVPGE